MGCYPSRGGVCTPNLKAGTKEYFDTSRKIRSEHEMPWLFDLIPFTSTKGKKVLEIGCGAGYDAYEFCRNGAIYTGIDLTPENIFRTQAHLAHYGFTPTIMIGDAEKLQFEKQHFNIVFSNGVLHHTPDINKAFQEAHRVLKPDGEFWLIVYNKNSFFYWVYIFLCEHIWRKGYKKHTMQERLSMIEYTTSTCKPLVNVYTKRSIKKLLTSAGFKVNKIRVRKLIKEDLPLFLRFLPEKLLNVLGRAWGWYLVIQTSK